MTIKKFAVLLWASLLATAAIAGEQHRTRIEIAVDDNSGPASFTFDSQAAGFNLHDMVVGESRQLVDDAGNVADISRTDGGFTLDFNGRTFDLDDLQGEHEIGLHLDAADTGVAVDDARKIRKVRKIKTGDADSVTIITGAVIDEATRQRIREVLESAGQQGDVVFIDGSEFDVDSDKHAHRRHEVRIIRKEVDVTN